MNIVINAILYHEKPRGVGNYLNNLIRELSEIDNKNNYIIYYGKWMKQYSFLKIKNKNFKFVEAMTFRNKIMRNLYQLLIFPIAILKYNPDILHIPDTSPILYKTCKTVSTIHDIAEYTYPQKYSKVQALARKVIVRFQCKKSDAIITVSEFSRKNIIRNFKLNTNRVIKIYNGINLENFCFTKSFNVGKKFNLVSEKYFLYVGEIERTKNIAIILETMKNVNLKKKFKIVICGKKGNDYENINNEIRKMNLQNNVIFTDYVTEIELRELYSHCFIFLFPSLFEGFGLPILEAMACGAPVICSNASSIPEVGGECVLKFDPLDKSQLLKNINLLIDNSELRSNMINDGRNQTRKFCWKETAKLTKDIYYKTIKDEYKVN